MASRAHGLYQARHTVQWQFLPSLLVSKETDAGEEELHIELSSVKAHAARHVSVCSHTHFLPV